MTEILDLFDNPVCWECGTCWTSVREEPDTISLSWWPGNTLTLAPALFVKCAHCGSKEYAQGQWHAQQLHVAAADAMVLLGHAANACKKDGTNVLQTLEHVLQPDVAGRTAFYMLQSLGYRWTSSQWTHDPVAEPQKYAQEPAPRTVEQIMAERCVPKPIFPAGYHDANPHQWLLDTVDTDDIPVLPAGDVRTVTGRYVAVHDLAGPTMEQLVDLDHIPVLPAGDLRLDTDQTGYIPGDREVWTQGNLLGSGYIAVPATWSGTMSMRWPGTAENCSGKPSAIDTQVDDAADRVDHSLAEIGDQEEQDRDNLQRAKETIPDLCVKALVNKETDR